MSTKYKSPLEVPTSTLAKRLKELVEIIIKRDNRLEYEFIMRIPAEYDYDADLVLHQASNRLEALEEDLLFQRSTMVMEYKGYKGNIEYDSDDKIYRGNVHSKDIVGFKGETLCELEKDFHNVIDDYIDFKGKDEV